MVLDNGALLVGGGHFAKRELFWSLFLLKRAPFSKWFPKGTVLAPSFFSVSPCHTSESMHRILNILPPVSAVEVMFSVPSVRLSVNTLKVDPFDIRTQNLVKRCIMTSYHK